jgi:hypothetical protein
MRQRFARLNLSVKQTRASVPRDNPLLGWDFIGSSRIGAGIGISATQPTRGPIEAGSLRVFGSLAQQFPRSIGRGPIEAPVPLPALR